MRNVHIEGCVDAERWKPVLDFPDYAISDYGRVKRLTTRTRAKAGSILKPCNRSKDRPYPSVDLSRNGKRRTQMIHILVARAFLGPAPFVGAEVNHIDGDKTNPHFRNLEWVTSSGNSLHAYEAGLADARGEANGQAKLTEAMVREIRDLAVGRRGEKTRIARQFGVSETAIRDILNGRTWSHI
ncbi:MULTISPECIES: HNH endonuclease [Burkholderia]|uniref:HNH endonuclease n=2 Tax=Burkholderia TaxID=32008 RepID=UPI00097BD473|nr:MULTISPECIES: HNH endonuclease [Burkholderia]MUV28855.1 HNH endonuclease [Burkholderia thailandensis]HEF4837325.1 HNH endonuclease [Burkholderia vietnamiensis]AQQ20238.1 hypothetical protein A8D61_18080 [Burkholderia cenocepacia]MBG0865492.1 HNH endonuclease [Burkholderia sp. 9779_493]MCW3503233.1 NUMOD4 motif-containing HNH endonuclease [Burkholderia cenocepacia]